MIDTYNRKHASPEYCIRTTTPNTTSKNIVLYKQPNRPQGWNGIWLPPSACVLMDEFLEGTYNSTNKLNLVVTTENKKKGKQSKIVFRSSSKPYTAALKRGDTTTNGSPTRNFASLDTLWLRKHGASLYAAELQWISGLSSRIEVHQQIVKCYSLHPKRVYFYIWSKSNHLKLN